MADKSIKHPLIIDTVNMNCPLPIFYLQKKMKPLNKGDCVLLIASDKATLIDVPHFCHEMKYTLKHHYQQDEKFFFNIAK